MPKALHTPLTPEDVITRYFGKIGIDTPLIFFWLFITLVAQRLAYQLHPD